MKTLMVALSLSLLAVSAQAKETLVKATLPSGESVTLKLDACYDPVTKTWGPCYVAAPEAQAAESQDACWNPETHRLEPCF